MRLHRPRDLVAQADQRLPPLRGLLERFPRRDPFPGLPKHQDRRGAKDEGALLVAAPERLPPSAPVAIIVAVGSFENTDCSTVLWNGTTAIYDAQQDPFGGEEPMYGFVSLDEEAVSTRLALDTTEHPHS